MNLEKRYLVAWSVSNSQDTLALIEFLKNNFKERGILQPKLFVTDDAEQYNGGVSGEGRTMKILWHID